MQHIKMSYSVKTIEDAIREIDNNPSLLKRRYSSTYDLIYNNKRYPPILVLSVASTLDGGKKLTLKDFGNSVEKPFEFLRSLGFEVVSKSSNPIPSIHEFVKVADEQEAGKGITANASDFIRRCKGEWDSLTMDISFGIGRAALIPWIAFIGYNQTVKKGIYPVYLYYRAFELLILAYGVSEKNNPTMKWKSDASVQTINEFFSQKISRKPERYGESFVFKAYDVKNLPEQKEMEKDLLDLIEIYRNVFSTSAISFKASSDLFEIRSLKSDLTNCGLFYSQLIVNSFIASLLTKPFVILTGLSGSGKTKLAQAFLQWICHDESQYRIIPVGADWTNREPLLGYPNALKTDDYVNPESGVLDLIIQANQKPNLPYFLILDEMNLSHVERYFADFLSVMESKGEISLYSEGIVIKGVPSKLKVPSNLFIIGTVNLDETTNMFSPKVLDRANTIEFRVTKEEMGKFLINIKDIDMDALSGKGVGMAQSFLEMARRKDFTTKDLTEINTSLILFFGELKKTGAEFGYRSATEILRLINQLSVLDANLTTNAKIDVAIIQKLLPKLHGSRRKLCPVLETLGSFCITGNVSIIKDVFEKADFDYSSADVIYPLSLEKISRMYRGAVDNGFASFAEA